MIVLNPKKGFNIMLLESVWDNLIGDTSAEFGECQPTLQALKQSLKQRANERTFGTRFK